MLRLKVLCECVCIKNVILHTYWSFFTSFTLGCDEMRIRGQLRDGGPLVKLGRLEWNYYTLNIIESRRLECIDSNQLRDLTDQQEESKLCNIALYLLRW